MSVDSWKGLVECLQASGRWLTQGQIICLNSVLSPVAVRNSPLSLEGGITILVNTCSRSLEYTSYNKLQYKHWHNWK